MIVVTSFAESLDGSTSPPPETAAMFVRVGGALLSTFTVSVMAGYEALAARTSFLVQVREERTQFQPAPVMAVAVRPVGRLSRTLTAPLVGAAPLLVTVIV